MFVYKNLAVSLDGLRQVFLKRVGTSGERGVLKYVDGCEVEVSLEMGKALLDHFEAQNKAGPAIPHRYDPSRQPPDGGGGANLSYGGGGGCASIAMDPVDQWKDYAGNCPHPSQAEPALER